MGVWDEVKTLVEQGVQPKIVLTPSHRIIVPKGKPGRPTKDKYKEAYLLTITGTRMRCRNPGCSHILRVWAENPACCAKCEKELREFCEVTLKALNGEIKMQEYPMWLRQLKGAGRGRKPWRNLRNFGVPEEKRRLRSRYALLAEELGVSYYLVYERMRYGGWTEDEVRQGFSNKPKSRGSHGKKKKRDRDETGRCSEASDRRTWDRAVQRVQGKAAQAQ
jgi:hypothetical protein